MINKQKATMIGVAVGVVVGLLIAGVVWVASNSGDTPQATPTPEPAPASPTTSTATEVPPKEDPKSKTAGEAAMAAAGWRGYETLEHQRTGYRAGGFHLDLVQSFTPVWRDIFDVPKVLHDSMGINANVEAHTDDIPDLVGRTGQAPHQQFRYAVKIAWRAKWSQKVPSETFAHNSTAVWHVTIDEASGTAVAVEQPARETFADLSAAIDTAQSSN